MFVAILFYFPCVLFFVVVVACHLRVQVCFIFCCL